MDREAAEKALIKLARQSASTWIQVRGDTFRGVTILETSNTTYRFEDGVFSGRAPRNPFVTTSAAPAWESPVALAGLELMGFLFESNGLWSLSPRWRPASLAVIWRIGSLSDDAFMLTSQTVTCTTTLPAPKADAASRARATATAATSPYERSSVFPVARIPRGPRIPAAAPSVRRPAPPSMTRLRPVPSR